MKIKQKALGLLLQGKNVEVQVSANDELHIKIMHADRVAEVSIPGEYEYGGVVVTALEITEETYTGNISIAKFIVENVSLVYTARDFKFNKEIKDNLSGADVLIVRDIDIKTLKEAIGALDPYTVIILSLKDKEKTDELKRAISKDFGVDNLDSEDVITISSSDFDTEEDVQLSFKALN